MDYKNQDVLSADALGVIGRVFGVLPSEICCIRVLKTGMTNRSFLFRCKGKQYIMRVPGKGTDLLMDRRREAAVYEALRGKDICDTVAYIDPIKGYKITAFLEDARVCDPADPGDVKRCMARLRQFHTLDLQVAHTFDIFGQIDFYESLRGKSRYPNYQKTKQQIWSLKTFIDKQKKQWCLTHMDAVPDNFLFAGDDLRLIDWEYAGMQDPHVDIAMFGIYAMYDQSQMDALIDAYFPEGCPDTTRTKIYCYIAACGLLWSNWCEYKQLLGVTFGVYAPAQYRYAKQYYRLAAARIAKGDG